jgi:hypothetical protein
MDRSTWPENPQVNAVIPTRLVRRDRSYYFVGTSRREVVYSVSAETMEEALQKFHSSAQAVTEIMFIIKTETEIYLAQGK